MASIKDRGVAFRTILTRIADHLNQEEINSIAYIRGLPPTDSGRERKGLDVLMLLERRGVFSLGNVAPLRELLGSANRHDLLHSCGIDEYEEKYCKKSPGELETERDEELPCETSKQLTTKNSGGSIAQDGFQPQDNTYEDYEYATKSLTTQLEARPEVSSGSPPASLIPPLSTLTEQDRKILLQSILDDKNMRDELTSLSKEMFPVHSIAVGGDDESLQSDHRLTNLRDLHPRSLSAGDLPMETTGSLTTSATGTQTQESLPNPSGQGLAQSAPNPSGQEFAQPVPHNPTGGGKGKQGCGSRQKTPNQHMGGSHHDKNVAPPVRKDRMTWKLNRKDICELTDKQVNRVFSKEFKLQVDGCRSKPVKLILKLHVNGLGHDKGNAASLGVLVKVEERCMQLKDMAMLNLLVSTRMGKVGQEEFISGKETRKPLANFVINDFMPHEILRGCQSRFIEMEAEAFLTFDREAHIDVSLLDDENGDSK